MSSLIKNPDSELESAESIKVSFYPAVDQYADIAYKINETHKFPTRAQHALTAFIALNMIGLPLTLWYFDYFLTGAAIFLLNIAFAIIFLPGILQADYRSYFRSAFGSIEDDMVEVELTNDGLWCRRSDDFSFVSWTSVKRIEESKQSINFYFEHTGVAVNKAGFAYDAEKDRFLSFAKNHVRQFTTV